MNAPLTITPGRELSAFERADKHARLVALLSGHRATCEQVIALAERHVSRPMLADLADRARGCIVAMNRTLANPDLTGTHGDLGRWGPNGHGPAIGAMLRSARFHASNPNWRAAIGVGPAALAVETPELERACG